MDDRSVVIERIVATARVVMLVGGMDTGKSTLARALARAALEAGRPSAYLDVDLGQKAVGPPTAVTLKMVRSPADLRPDAMADADALSFVGSTSPQGQLLPLVVAAGRLLDVAQREGAEFVVVDTSGLVAGVYGQLLKFHKLEQLRPDALIGLQRGEELEQLLGIAQRFFPLEVLALPVHPNVRALSVEERARNREAGLERYFREPLSRWRVRPSVFMPALPALFDPRKLDRLLVGLADGTGRYLGLGYLEMTDDEDALRLVSPVAEAPRGLRLGSVRVEEGFRVRRVDLRNLFGTD